MRLRPLQVSGVSSTVTCAEQLCGCVCLSLRCCHRCQHLAWRQVVYLGPPGAGGSLQLSGAGWAVP